MTTFFLSTLLLLTIIAAFALGIAAGYWVILAFLNFFNPIRTRNRASRAATLAPTSGD
jgi:predicted membrane protein